MTGPGRLVVVSGPGGVGKGTVVERLRARRPDIVVSVSATTRQPRSGEVDGAHYHFLSDAEFDALLADDGLLEHAAFGGSRYGTPRSSVEPHLSAGTTVLLEIDVQGAFQVREHHPDALLVFIAPPRPEVLAERLRARGTDPPARIEERLAIARRELAAADAFDHVITNDRVEAAVDELDRILAR